MRTRFSFPRFGIEGRSLVGSIKLRSLGDYLGNDLHEFNLNLGFGRFQDSALTLSAVDHLGSRSPPGRDRLGYQEPMPLFRGRMKR